MAKTCPNCGTQNRDLARYCQNCRQALDITCPACGLSNVHQANFCTNCGEPFQPGSQPLAVGLAPGTLLDNRYCIEARLGGGGMGAVYLAFDQRLSKRWAIKEMSDAALTEPAEKLLAVQAFENEARLLANLDHYNLPKVNNHFQENGKYYLVMDFIDGKTLDEMLSGTAQGQPAQPFDETQVLHWAEDICGVLTYLHSQNPPVIFRDLKPGNVMIETSGRLRLIDFGVARLFKPGKVKDTSSFGTRGFAPPEQYGSGQTDPRSDIYALGATMHYLLTLRDPGDDPFHFPPAESLNERISSSTSEAIARAVSFERADRWNSAAEFLLALKASSAKAARNGGKAEKPKRKSSAPLSAPAVVATTETVAQVPGAPGRPAAAQPENTSDQPARQKPARVGTRRSGPLEYLLWVALCTGAGYLLVRAAAVALGAMPGAYLTNTQTIYDSRLITGLVIAAIASLPQVIALLRTRLPGAVLLPALILQGVFTVGRSELLSVVGMVFTGMLIAELVFLLQSFRPRSFWQLFFGALTAHWAVHFIANGKLTGPEYYLGIALGVAASCAIGWVVSGLFHWDS